MKITLVSGCDWKGIYINGHLEYEGHQITDFQWIEILTKCNNTEVDVGSLMVDEEWLSDRGTLPKQLKDVAKRNDDY